MGVDHRRANVAMAQEFLDSANVIAGSQQVRGKRMPKRVASDSLGQSRLSDDIVAAQPAIDPSIQEWKDGLQQKVGPSLSRELRTTE